ncbi:MAG: hypothetical protein ACM35G_10910, partial [Planctomycetaceae bacterium]
MLIEPPSADRVERIVRKAIHAYEERLYADIHARLPYATRARLDMLLRPASSESGGVDGAEPPGTAPALLMRLRGDPGRASLAGV